DTRSRRLELPSGAHVILTDTVGFIRDMPKDLFAAFRATFEEAADADVLLELVDASDPEEGEHRRTTEQLLKELDLASVPRLGVFNQVDRVDPEVAEALAFEDNFVLVSALDRASIAPLLDRLEEILATRLNAAGRRHLPARAGSSEWDDEIWRDE